MSKPWHVGCRGLHALGGTTGARQLPRGTDCLQRRQSRFCLMLSWLARVVRPCAHGVRVRDVSRGTPVVVCRLASVGGQSRPRVEGPPPQRGSRARVEPIPSVSSACVPRFRQRDCCEPPGGSCGLWDELAPPAGREPRWQRGVEDENGTKGKGTKVPKSNQAL